MMKKILIGVLVFISTLLQAKPIVVNLNPTTIQFEVPLPANPSTGYQWELKNYDRNLFSLIRSKFVPENPKLVGAGGTMIYTFQLNKGLKTPRMTSIIFAYFRPWDKSSETMQTVHVNFLSETIR